MGGWSPSEKIYHLHKRRRWIRNRSYTASIENTVKSPNTKVNYITKNFKSLLIENIFKIEIRRCVKRRLGVLEAILD